VPAPTPKSAPVVEKAEATPPATLPKTASPLPLAGLFGLALTGASICLRSLRRAR
jgi:hypothetical protein